MSGMIRAGVLLQMLPLLPLILLVVSCCFRNASLSSASEATDPGSEEGAQSRQGSVRRRSAEECRSVSDVFAGYSFDEDPVIPTRKISGQNLGICNETSTSTCCTKSMEEPLISVAVFQTQDVVANFTMDLKSRLTWDAKSYRDHFNELLSVSAENTRVTLTSNFKIPVAKVNASVEKLFSDLAAYIRIQDQVNVKQSVNQFFDAIFPLFFTFSLDNSNVSLMLDGYHECVGKSRKDLKPPPFGEVGRKLVQDVAKSLEVTRALLDAFDLMVEAVNITSHLGNEQYCSHAIARVLFCSRCEGLVEVQPCRNLCLNVMRGCAAHVAEVNGHWNLFVTAVDRLVNSLRGMHDVQDVLNSFHSKVYDSVTHCLRHLLTYHRKMISECGPALVGVTVEMMNTSGEAGASMLYRTNSSTALQDWLPTRVPEKFSFSAILRNIASSKGFFNKLSDVVCDSERFSPNSHNSTCWNGTAVSKYSRSVPAAALTTQVAENPELQVPSALVPDVVKLIEKLNQMTRVLHKRVIAQSNPYNDYGSGIGFSGTGWDDDPFRNYYDISGSGGSGGSGNDSTGEDHTTGGEFNHEFNLTDTTDFVFDPKSTTSPKQSPYRTTTPDTIALNSNATVATTTPTTITTTSTATAKAPIKSDPTVRSHGTVTSVVFFLQILAITIQRISSA